MRAFEPAGQALIEPGQPLQHAAPRRLLGLLGRDVLGDLALMLELAVQPRQLAADMGDPGMHHYRHVVVGRRLDVGQPQAEQRQAPAHRRLLDHRRRRRLGRGRRPPLRLAAAPATTTAAAAARPRLVLACHRSRPP
jgi:hypothetical protein